jgi:hypothetical protein
MNGFPPTIYVIPEDDEDRQLANGFRLSDYVVNALRLKVMPVAGGWPKVKETFETEYINWLRKYPNDVVVMVIDFDGKYADRYAMFAEAIPHDLKDRAFVIGPREEPKDLRHALGEPLEDIGRRLAKECADGISDTWDHEHLRHNTPDRDAMATSVRSILFR